MSSDAHANNGGGRSARATRFVGTYNEEAIAKEKFQIVKPPKAPKEKGEGGEGPVGKPTIDNIRPRTIPEKLQHRPIMRVYYTSDHINTMIRHAVPWLPLPNEANMFWAKPSGKLVLEALLERMQNTWHRSDIQGTDMEVWEFGDRTSLDAWLADEARRRELVEENRLQEAREVQPSYRHLGRGLTAKELLTAVCHTMMEGSFNESDYFVHDFERSRVTLADALYQLAMGEFKPPPNCKLRPVGGFGLTEEEKTFLKAHIHDQSDCIQQLRNPVRLADVVSFLLQLDGLDTDHMMEKKIVDAIRYLDAALNVKENVIDDLVHLLDAMLAETTGDAADRKGRAAEDDSDAEDFSDEEEYRVPEPREEDEDWLPPGRTLEEFFLIERRKPTVDGKPRKGVTRAMKDGKYADQRLIHVRLGDRVMIPHEVETAEGKDKEKGDQGKAHLWMGRVVEIRQNIRGRIMFKMVWDYHFLDQAEIYKNSAAGRKVARMRDVRTALQQDAVLSRLYMSGIESNEKGLWLWQTVVNGMRVCVPRTASEPAAALEDWQVQLRVLTSSDFANGLPDNVEQEVYDSFKLGPGKGTYILTGTFQKDRFQNFYHADDQKPAPADPKDGPVVLNMLEPCCGCGGLSAMAGTYNMENGVTVKMVAKWGVDIDAGACQSFAVNHPGSTAYNMRFDEFILMVLHRELLTRHLLEEGDAALRRERLASSGKKEKGGKEASASEGEKEEDSFDRPSTKKGSDDDIQIVEDSDEAEEEEEEEGDEEEEEVEEKEEGGLESESEDGEESQEPEDGLEYRVDQVRLFKNILQHAPASRRPSGHPLEFDRTEDDLPGMDKMKEELHREFGVSEKDGGVYVYRPSSFKHSWLEMDFTARRPDGSFHRVTRVHMNSAEALEVWHEPLMAFLESDRMPRRSTVGVIASGPPCQGLTGLNYGDRSKRNTAHKTMTSTKNSVLLQVLEGVGIFKPEYVVIENVVGSKQTYEGLYQLVARGGLIRHGYQYRTALLNSGRYLVPQDRRRIILFAARPDQHLPAFPRPLNRDPLARTLRKLHAGAVMDDQDQMTITMLDLDPKDLNNPPAVVGDIMGSMQDLSLAGGGAPEEGYRSAPRTPLQLVLRWAQDPVVAELKYKVGGTDRYFSSEVESLVHFHALTKAASHKVTRNRASKKPKKHCERGAENSDSEDSSSEEEDIWADKGRKKRASAPSGKINPANYTNLYPTTYFWTPEELEDIAPPNVRRKRAVLPAKKEEGQEQQQVQEGEKMEVEEAAAPRPKTKPIEKRFNVVDSVHNHDRLPMLRDNKAASVIREKMDHILDYGLGKLDNVEDELDPESRRRSAKPEVLSASGNPIVNMLHPYGVSMAVTMEKAVSLAHPHPDPDRTGADLRFCSIREQARIQTFPDHLVLRGCGSTAINRRISLLHQIANAVPCHMARALGTCLASAAAGSVPSQQELLRVTDRMPGVSDVIKRARREGLKFFLEAKKRDGSWRVFCDERHRELDRAILKAQGDPGALRDARAEMETLRRRETKDKSRVKRELREQRERERAQQKEKEGEGKEPEEAGPSTSRPDDEAGGGAGAAGARTDETAAHPASQNPPPSSQKKDKKRKLESSAGKGGAGAGAGATPAKKTKIGYEPEWHRVLKGKEAEELFGGRKGSAKKTLPPERPPTRVLPRRGQPVEIVSDSDSDDVDGIEIIDE